MTLVTLERCQLSENGGETMGNWKILAGFELPSQPGNERLAMEKVAGILKDFPVPQSILQRLQTAVAEATMNAMEHGNHYQADKPVAIQVLSDGQAVSVRITDQGGDQSIPENTAPDLEAKLAGLQSPRGWGLFLIEKMVDEMHVNSDADHHTIELIVRVKEGENAH